jgi:hypothetical protein
VVTEIDLSAVPPEDRAAFANASATRSEVLDGINVIQISLPIYEMTFSGAIELKYIPEKQESVFLVKDDMGPTRTMYVPKYIHDDFIEEYFEQRVKVTARIIRHNGQDILFVKDIERL